MGKHCENCLRRIGWIKRYRQKFFQAKVWEYSLSGLIRFPKNVYFCSAQCIIEYEWTHPNMKILN